MRSTPEPELIGLARKGSAEAAGALYRTQIAVRSPKGKPLVYGEVLDSGKVTLFLEPNTCF